MKGIQREIVLVVYKRYKFAQRNSLSSGNLYINNLDLLFSIK